MKTSSYNLLTAKLKRRVQAMTLILLGGLLWPSISLAYVGLCCAHCGGNMPLNIPGGGIPEPHEYRLKVSQMIMSMGPLRDGTTNLSEGSLLAPTGTFAVVPSAMQMYMTMIGGAYSFTDNFALMAMTSFRFNRMQMEFNGVLQGVTGEAGFTMESRGFGDIKLLGKYRLYSDDNLAPRDQVSALFGVSVPTGNIDKKFRNNPVPGQNGTILPFKMQLGSGTFDPIFGMAYQGSQDPFWYGATALYTARVYDNNRGYQQGDEFRLDLYGMYQYHEKSVAFLQLNGSWEDRYSDEPDAGRLGQGHFGNNPAAGFLSPLFDPANYGGRKLAVTAGIQWQPLPLNVIELNGSVPFYQDLRGPQLKEDFRVMLSWYIEIPTERSRRFTGTNPPKELGF
jgi:hypothetical protein